VAKRQEVFSFSFAFLSGYITPVKQSLAWFMNRSIPQATFPQSPENYLENKNFTFLKKSFITV
jgi:hypothetical protein